MPEPTSVVAAAGTVAASPVLVLLGTQLGLQPSNLIAGAFGAAIAILMFDAVPSTGDGARELARTTLKRVGFALGSALFAGFAAPVAGPIVSALLGVLIPADALGPLAAPIRALSALLLGCGAQRFIKALIDRAVQRARGTPDSKPEGGAS